ncbi:MAG: hypothetical protein ABJI69_03065 [Balneola sp.]|jgi:hypothetical protein
MRAESLISYVVLGVILNLIVAAFIIDMAEAGHSIFAYYFGYLLPFISLFSYLSYRKFRNHELATLKIKHFLRPSQFLSIITVVGFLAASIIFSVIYNEKFSLSYFSDIGLFIVWMLVIVVIPNSLLQIGYFIFYLKKTKKQ